MMNIFSQKKLCRLMSLALAFLMLFSLAACNNNQVDPPVTDPVTEPVTEPENPPENLPTVSVDELTYLDMGGKTAIRAAYVGRKDTTPMYVTIPTVAGAPRASVGATWTETGMKVYVTFDSATALTVALNGVSKNPAIDGTTAVAEFTYEEIGVRLADLGQNIPLTVTVGNGTANATFDGFACLRDYATFAYTNAAKYSDLFKNAKLSIHDSTKTVSAYADIGAKSQNGVMVMYDRYSANANYNYAHLREYVATKQITDIKFATKTLLAEFDLNIKSMPEIEWKWINTSASYGLSFVMSESNSSGKSVMLTFVNTEAGLVLYCLGESEGKTQMIYTGKQIGENLHVALMWAPGGTLTVYINGYYVGEFTETVVNRSGYGDNAAGFVWLRPDSKPSGAKQNFEAEIDNLGFAAVNDFGLIKTLTATNILGEERTVIGAYLATQNLSLPTSMANTKYGIDTPLYWRSSDPSVIANDGTLTPPTDGAGKLVEITAYLADGKTIVSERNFTIFVKAANPSTNVLLKEYDIDPYTGSANAQDNTCIIDDALNSIVYDMGSKQKINRAVISSMHTKNRLTGNYVALYVSDDNQTYTAVEEFCMLHSGNDVHFFNFDVEARYLKIHFTYTTGNDFAYSLYNSLQRAMKAYYTANPLLDGNGSFSGSTTVTVVNDGDKPVYNKLVTYTLDQLGIAASALKADLSDIRFRANGKECPHYYSGGRFYVRVPEVPANGSVTVNVLYGNASAQNISNATATLEIEYGTKVLSNRMDGDNNGRNPAWRNSVAVMPNGSLCRMGPYYDQYIGVEHSYDGGHTWTDTRQVGDRIMQEGGGFIVDFENNKVFYLCYGQGYTWILASEDSGETWTHSNTNRFKHSDYKLLMTYSDGIKLSTYDGEGENVDYVITVVRGSSKDWDQVNCEWTNGLSSIYSKDGGATWHVSESIATFGYPAAKYDPTLTYWSEHEGGMSEETVWEKEDGTLIAYARQQSYVDGNGDIPHFAVVYSYDHGVTWDQDSVKTSSVYTSSATQPILDSLNGTPMLLWGGNNSHGFRSYDRFPLNIAYSADDAENFMGILDISFQTAVSHRIEYRPSMEKWIITNPDIAVFEKGGTDHAYIVITNQFFLIENFSNYLYKTKGAYDSFELGDYKAEGWVSVSGSEVDPGEVFVAGDLPTLSQKGATDGDYALRLGSQTQVSRSVPYVVNGELFFDLYVDSFGSGFDIDLQAAYNRSDATISTPIRIRVTSNGDVCYYDENGTLQSTAAKLQLGQNTVSISFNGEAGTASLTANGVTDNIAFKKSAGAYVCFVMIKNGNKTAISLDRFGLVDMD